MGTWIYAFVKTHSALQDMSNPNVWKIFKNHLDSQREPQIECKL